MAIDRASDNPFPSILLVEGDPEDLAANPSSGQRRLAVGPDHLLYLVDPAGAATLVGSGTDHGSLAGLSDDDHTQYQLRSTLTTRGDLYYRGAASVGRLALGSTGKVLTSDGTDASWQTPSAGFTDPMTTRGDLIIRNASNVTARLGRGSATQVLTSDGTDLAWATPSSGFADPMTSRGDVIVRNASNATDRLAKGVAGTALRSDGTDVAYSMVPGTILGSKSYAAGGALQATTATMIDADATNLAVAFTAPPSGNVIVRVSGTMRSAVSAGNRVYWGIRESTTDIVPGAWVYTSPTGNVATILESRSRVWLLTGISAGAHTYKWSVGADAASGGLFLDANNPILMEVVAL